VKKKRSSTTSNNDNYITTFLNWNTTTIYVVFGLEFGLGCEFGGVDLRWFELLCK